MKSLIAKLLIAPALVLGVFGLVATTAYAQECDVDLDDPLRTSSKCAHNPSTPTDLWGEGGAITTITNVLLFIIGSVSVIMIIYGGIQYVTSGGDSSKVQNAKNTILYSIVGVIVAILAYAIVNFVIGAFATS